MEKSTKKSPTSQVNIENLLGRELFERIPFNIAVIDRNFKVVAANKNFEEYFGNWQGQLCHQVYKRSSERCENCLTMETFKDGLVRVSDETGIDRHGRTCHYVGHVAPLYNQQGSIEYVLEMTSDLTETKRWQREYNLLFERVPCYIAIIDRHYRVIRANEKFRQTFGDVENEYCYEVYKRRKTPCRNCPAALTFQDGAEHVSTQTGVRQDGTPSHYVVTTSPLSRGEQGIAHVIEIATDITEVKDLQNELKQAHDLYESLIRNSSTGILAVDPAGLTRIINPAARSILNWKAKRPPTSQRLEEMLPDEFFGGEFHRNKHLEIPDINLRTAVGEDVPVQFKAMELKSRGKRLGCAAFIEDLREIKRLEKEKLDAERLAAVGHTVAGLAHTIKNLLMGLEGGMYMVDTGLRKGDAERIFNGWEVLQRNFEKTTTLVKDFLSFAKGRLPNLKKVDPNTLAKDIVDLYHEAAHLQGVELVLETDSHLDPLPLDPEGIETCLTNLVSNAIDAAIMREEHGGRVVLKTYEKDDALFFEVSDNGCGMDWEVKQRVFTTFFTTKGGKGTGLGLLTTRKIIQEHGGQIEMDSIKGEGSVFRIRLPKLRLEMLSKETTSSVQTSKEKV